MLKNLGPKKASRWQQCLLRYKIAIKLARVCPYIVQNVQRVFVIDNVRTVRYVELSQNEKSQPMELTRLRRSLIVIYKIK